MKLIFKEIKSIKTVVFLVFIIWIVFLIGVQFGIYRGRNLEQQKRNLQQQKLEKLERILENVDSEIQTYEILIDILSKESDFLHHNVWGKDGEYGIAQFKEETFYWLAKKAKMRNPNWKNQIQQILLLNWAIRNDYAKLWSTYKNESKISK